MTYDFGAPCSLEFEFRANPDGTDTFTGYAAVFNSPSQPLPFIERIDPTAFNRTLGMRTRKQFVVNHNDAQLISSTDTGRLNLAADSKGLLVESPLGATSYARDLRALADVGELSGMSFSFRAYKGGEKWNEDMTQRTLTAVDLGHVTVLTGLEPAYHATSGKMQVRSLALAVGAHLDDIDALIDALRDGTLTDEQRDLLRRVADEIAPPAEPEPTTEAPAEEPEARDVNGTPNLDVAKQRLASLGLL